MNAGVDWTTLTGPADVWHVAAAPPATAGQENTRRLYALGTQLWISNDGGTTWTADASNTVTGSQPHDAVGPSTRLLAIHPANPNVIYVVQVVGPAAIGTIFRGDCSAAAPVWNPLTGLPAHPPSTTASGTEYVKVFATQEGSIYIFVSDRSALWVGKGEQPASWTRLDEVDFHATGADIGLKHIDPHSLYLSQDFRLDLRWRTRTHRAGERRRCPDQHGWNAHLDAHQRPDDLQSHQRRGECSKGPATRHYDGHWRQRRLL